MSVNDATSPLHFAHVYAEVLRGYDQYAQFNIANYPEEGGKVRRAEELIQLKLETRRFFDGDAPFVQTADETMRIRDAFSKSELAAMNGDDITAESALKLSLELMGLWWDMRGHTILGRMIRWAHKCPAASGSIERIWSFCKALCTPERNALGVHKLGLLLSVMLYLQGITQNHIPHGTGGALRVRSCCVISPHTQTNACSDGALGNPDEATA